MTTVWIIIAVAVLAIILIAIWTLGLFKKPDVIDLDASAGRFCRFWWSQTQYEIMQRNAPLYQPPLKPKTRPDEVLVDDEWLNYSCFTSKRPSFDDIELVAELYTPIRIRVEGREMGL